MDVWRAQLLGREPYSFHTNTGEPPAVLKRLIEKGWMWAQRIDRQRWMPKAQRWDQEPGSTFRCGLTAAGFRVIEEIKERHLVALSEG